MLLTKFPINRRLNNVSWLSWQPRVYSVVSIKRTGCNKRTGGENSPKIVNRTGCIKRTGWTFCQKQLSKQGFFYQLKAILNRKTCQYHDFNHKPDYISLRKQKNCIKRQKKISAIRVDFFSKIVKRTGSNNCEQGGKKLQNS